MLENLPFAIDDRIITAANAGAVVALNLSGGKDSTMSAHAANAILDKIGHPRERRILIHADLGRAEWRSTPATVEAQAAQIGLPLIVTRRAAGDMVARFEQRYEQGWSLYSDLKLARLRGPWSHSGGRFCTAEMKRDVLHRYLTTAYPGQTIISVLGIRHAESPGRSKTPISKVDVKLARANGTNGILWHPSIHISTEQVFAYHAQHGLILHEAYEQWGSTRLSCAFCVLASRQDIRISANVPQNLELYRYLVDIEIATGFSFQQGGWLCDVAPGQLLATQQERISRAKAYAAERKRREAGISAAFLKAAANNDDVRSVSDADAAAIASSRQLNADWTGRPLDFLTAAAVRQRLAA